MRKGRYFGVALAGALIGAAIGVFAQRALDNPIKVEQKKHDRPIYVGDLNGDLIYDIVTENDISGGREIFLGKTYNLYFKEVSERHTEEELKWKKKEWDRIQRKLKELPE